MILTIFDAIHKGKCSDLESFLGVINVPDGDGKTPLHHAMDNMRIKMVKFLLANGAEVNVQDANGITPLHLAVKLRGIDGYFQMGIIRLLTTNGADPNIADNEGNTPLHLATSWDYVALYNHLILERGAKNLANKKGERPSDLAKRPYRLEPIGNYFQTEEASTKRDP